MRLMTMRMRGEGGGVSEEENDKVESGGGDE